MLRRRLNTIDAAFSRTFLDNKKGDGSQTAIKVQDILNKAQGSDSIGKAKALNDAVQSLKKEYQPEIDQINYWSDVLANGGISSTDGVRFDYKDLVTSSFLHQFIPNVVEVIMKGEMEPRTPISTTLFDQIQHSTISTLIEMGSMSNAIVVEEVGELPEYKTVSFSIDGGNKMRVNIKKYGLKFGVTKEAEELDQWGILTLFLQKIAAAFARKREAHAMDIMRLHGQVMYDNANPGNSEFGVTTGRNIAGGANGTMSPKDLLWTYVYLQHRGFNPDTLIMHPFAWMIFASNPETRELMLSGNKIGNYSNIPTSGYSEGFGTRLGKFGPRYIGTGGGLPDPVLGKIGSHYRTQQLNPMGASFQVQPQFSPTPFNIIISPLVGYYKLTSGAYASSIIMADSSNVGCFINVEAITTEGWMDIEHEARWTKVRERYGAAPYSAGKAIALMNNIIIDEQFVFDNVNSVSLSPIASNYNFWGGVF